jgi:hypothetical protein
MQFAAMGTAMLFVIGCLNCRWGKIAIEAIVPAS